MTLREIKEDEAIYYIGELAISDGEVSDLHDRRDAEQRTEPFTVRFKKQFFVDAK